MAMAISARCSTAAAHRRLQGSGLALAQPQDPPGLPQGAAAALMWSIHLDNGVLVWIFGNRRKHSGPDPAGRTTLSAVTANPRLAIARTAPSSGTSSAGGAADQDHQGADETIRPQCPSSERAGTMALYHEVGSG